MDRRQLRKIKPLFNSWPGSINTSVLVSVTFSPMTASSETMLLFRLSSALCEYIYSTCYAVYGYFSSYLCTFLIVVLWHTCFCWKHILTVILLFFQCLQQLVCSWLQVNTGVPECLNSFSTCSSNRPQLILWCFFISVASTERVISCDDNFNVHRLSCGKTEISKSLCLHWMIHLRFKT